VSGVTLFLAQNRYIRDMIFMGIAVILLSLVVWSTAGEDWGC
jgi:hypothetical protein